MSKQEAATVRFARNGESGRDGSPRFTLQDGPNVLYYWNGSLHESRPHAKAMAQVRVPKGGLLPLKRHVYDTEGELPSDAGEVVYSITAETVQAEGSAGSVQVSDDLVKKVAEDRNVSEATAREYIASVARATGND